MGILKSIWQSVVGVPPKFAYTDETITYQGEQLKRIRALRRIELDIEGRKVVINPGELGGYLAFHPNHPNEGHFHLPHGDESWIGGNAKCCGLSKLSGDSLLTGDAVVSDSVVIYKSFVGGNAHLSGSTKSYFSKIFGNAWIRNAMINNSWLFDRVKIDGCADIHTCAIYDNAKITVSGEFASIRKIDVSYARIFGDADIRYPIEDQICNYGLGPYKNKAVSGGLIDSSEAFDSAEKRGLVKELGRNGCVIKSPHGYEQIEAVLPLKSVSPPIHK
jgi:hypothetical protein